MVNTARRRNFKQDSLYISLPTEIKYTGGDIVHGVVRVDPTLRPQHINVCFIGYASLHDHVTSNCAKTVFFEYSQDLFASTGQHGNLDVLRIGAASDGKVELPFQFTFPSTVQLPPPEDRIWINSQDSYDFPRFQHSPGFLLPPTLKPHAKYDSSSAPTITYSVEATMESNVSRIIVHQELESVPLPPDYDQTLLEPHPELSAKLPKYCPPYRIVRTRRLIPGYENSSKREKLRDKFTEKEIFYSTFTNVPFAKFLILATAARVLVLGASVPIIMTVRHLDRSPSLENPPDLFMRRIRIRLLSTLSIFIPRPANRKCPRKEHIEYIRDTITLFDRRFDQANGEPLYHGLNLADIADIKLTSDKLLPSFTSYGINLEYEIKVELWGECAKHECSGIVYKDKVQVVPGWIARPPGDEESLLELTDPIPPYHESDPFIAVPDPVPVGDEYYTVPYDGSRLGLEEQVDGGFDGQRVQQRLLAPLEPPPYAA